MIRSLAGWALAALLLSPAGPPPYGLPLEGEAAEAFLRAARVTEIQPIGTGITHPEKATLTDGQRTLHGVFKTIDQSRPGITEFDHGRPEVDFRDSYKFEIAAYELDKLL